MLWKMGTKLVRDASGRLVICDDCPCPEDTGTGTGTEFPYPTFNLSECLCDVGLGNPGNQFDNTGTGTSTPYPYLDSPCPPSEYGGLASTVLFATLASFSGDHPNCSAFVVGETYPMTYQGVCCVGSNLQFTMHIWVSDPISYGVGTDPAGCDYLVLTMICNQGLNKGYICNLSIHNVDSVSDHCDGLSVCVNIREFTICYPFDPSFPCDFPCTTLGPPGSFLLSLTGPGDIASTHPSGIICNTIILSGTMNWEWVITD